MKLNLKVMEEIFTVHRFQPGRKIPAQVFESRFFSITKTGDELSIVCPSSVALDSDTSEVGWAAIKVLGPLDFSLTGILADISRVLAEADISLFAVSTFDTDYILVKSERIGVAKAALQKAAYLF